MKIAGIVAEYNPFHTGHLWQLEETRRLGATHIVAVMSGCYVQRGEPARWDKWVRARAALHSGVDLVIELPLPYAMASAQRFAFGAVSLLEGLGVVEMLSFGSECGQLEPLACAARAIQDSAVEAETARRLAEGMSYAAARQQAVAALYGSGVAELLAQPNNILGIEYMAALHRLGSGILPLTLPRMGGGHHSTQTQDYASATTLRRLAAAGEWDRLTPYLPRSCRDILVEAWQAGACYDPALLERPLLAQLRRLTAEQLATLPDISEGLENRIYQGLRSAESISELLDSVKTKRYTHARLRRILLAGWVGLQAGMDREPPPYLRILGMTGRGQEILTLAGQGARLPMSQSLARLEETGEQQRKFARLEAVADDLYGTLTPKVQPCGRDYTNSIIKVL